MKKKRLLKFLSSIFAAFLIISNSISATPAVYADSSNNSFAAENPFLINSESELLQFASRVNNGETALNARLESDIALSADWTPIWNYSGTFDGNGHTVSGVLITENSNISSNSNLGFFGCIKADAIVRNLNLEITFCDLPDTVREIGGISAKNLGRINNCSVDITANLNGYTGWIGGITGQLVEGSYYSLGKIKDCCVCADVTVNNAAGSVYAGGISATMYNACETDSCAVSGRISIISEAEAETINSGEVHVGGIAAYVYNPDSQKCVIKNCINKAEISTVFCAKPGDAVSKTRTIGGIAGELSGNCMIVNCVNRGNISYADNNDYAEGENFNTRSCVGGIAGLNNGSKVYSCAHLGKISIDDTAKVLKGSVSASSYAAEYRYCYVDSGIAALDKKTKTSTAGIYYVEHANTDGTVYLSELVHVGNRAPSCNVSSLMNNYASHGLYPGLRRWNNSLTGFDTDCIEFCRVDFCGNGDTGLVLTFNSSRGRCTAIRRKLLLNFICIGSLQNAGR